MSEVGRQFLRRFFTALSLGNLLALHVWLVLFRPAQETPMPGEAFAGAIVSVLVLGGGLFLARYLVDMVPSRDWRLGIRFVGLGILWALIAWAAIKPSAQQLLQQAAGVMPMLAIGLLATLMVLLRLILKLRWAEGGCKAMLALALVLSPYAVLNFGHASWEIGQRGLMQAAALPVDVPRLAVHERRQRTIVLLFDEFDYELAFEPNHRRYALPVIDHLRSQALFATQAYSPMHSTAMSVPAMLTGRLVEQGSGSNGHPGDLDLQYVGGAKVLWSTQDTLFTDLRAVGRTSLRLNDALFPHRPLKGPAEADFVVPPAPHSLTTVAQYAASNVSTVATLLPFATSRALDLRLNRLFGLPPHSLHVQRVADQIVDLAGDARADLLFLHILLPHLPVVVDATSGQFADVVSSEYRDNFVGVDHVVGRVIERLRESNRLGETNLVILSDHFFRFKRARYGLGDHRIPFLVRFGQDEKPVGDFARPFNTVLLRAMVKGVVVGEINDSRALGRWLETHAQFGESPLTEYRKGW